MRIAVASGKGGAGKTMVSASLAAVWGTPVLAVDADVEAPNLHLFLKPELTKSQPVYLEVPQLNASACNLCGACRDICRFKAIAKLGKKLKIFPDMCHGCGGCFAVCPTAALERTQRELGHIEEGNFSVKQRATQKVGMLGAAEPDASGLNNSSFTAAQPCLQVNFLMGRSRIGEAMTPPQLRALDARTDELINYGSANTVAANYASSSPTNTNITNANTPDSAVPAVDVIIDSPPGVSCPAMTVTRNADIVLLVAEPTPFGFHDFRLAHQAFSAHVGCLAVVMNRSGLAGNSEGDTALRAYCREHSLPLLAELPFERKVAEAYANAAVIAASFAEWHERFSQLREQLRALHKNSQNSKMRPHSAPNAEVPICAK